jgi:hypothetical protein
VDPVTATLPVVPDSVHSGVPPFAGAAIGHGLASVDVSTSEGGENTSETEEEVGVDEVSVSELHAASVMANDAAQAASATEEETRDEFTVRHATSHIAAVADSGHVGGAAHRSRCGRGEVLIAVGSVGRK